MLISGSVGCIAGIPFVNSPEINVRHESDIIDSNQVAAIQTAQNYSKHVTDERRFVAFVLLEFVRTTVILFADSLLPLQAPPAAHLILPVASCQR